MVKGLNVRVSMECLSKKLLWSKWCPVSNPDKWKITSSCSCLVPINGNLGGVRRSVIQPNIPKYLIYNIIASILMWLVCGNPTMLKVGGSGFYASDASNLITRHGEVRETWSRVMNGLKFAMGLKSKPAKVVSEQLIGGVDRWSMGGIQRILKVGWNRKREGFWFS